MKDRFVCAALAMIKLLPVNLSLALRDEDDKLTAELAAELFSSNEDELQDFCLNFSFDKQKLLKGGPLADALAEPRYAVFTWEDTRWSGLWDDDDFVKYLPQEVLTAIAAKDPQPGCVSFAEDELSFNFSLEQTKAFFNALSAGKDFFGPSRFYPDELEALLKMRALRSLSIINA